MWTFLTGPYEEVKRTVEGGLKVAMGRSDKPDDFLNIFHGGHLVLVDARGRIRGFYDPEKPEAIDTLMRDVAMLVGRGD
jgi:cytochrome oxidase Cu insertion factor (SCO1/SenC/PrrC family)